MQGDRVRWRGEGVLEDVTDPLVLHAELNTNFANVFKAVVFAIYDDHNAQKQHNLAGNLKPFAEVVPSGALLALAELPDCV